MNSPGQFRRIATILVIGGVAFVPAATSRSQEQRPRFRADVDVVRVDVIATDEDGAFVDDLALDEFVLYEDGERKELTQAQLVDLRADVVQVAGAPAAEAADAESRAPDVAPGRARSPLDVARSPELGAMVFLVEPARLSYWAQRRFVEAWADLAQSASSYNAPKAVYLIDSMGRLREVMPLTTDDQAMRHAGDALDHLIFPGAAEGSADNPQAAEEIFSIRDVQERAMEDRTLAVLESLAASLSTRRGRKAIVWVSPGLPTVSFGLWAMIRPETVRQLEQLEHTANSTNTSIYAVDPTLVTERYGKRRSSDVRRRIGPADEFLSDIWDTRVLRFDGMRDALRVVAKSTGGAAYPYTTKVARALDEIRADLERYYLLAYPRAPEGDGEYHDVRVETTRPGVTIRARAGYTDYAPEDLALIHASSGLAFPSSSAAPGLGVSAYGSWADDGRPRLQVALDVGQWLADEPAADAERVLQLALRATDGAGRVIDSRFEVISWSIAGTGPRPSVYVYDWPLRYGSFEIDAALVDRATMTTAAGRVSVYFPEPGDGWRLSQPILLAPSPAGLLEAVVDPGRHRGPLGAIYFESWSETEPSVTARAAGDDRLLPVSSQQLGDGRYAVIVSLAAVRPGTDEVHVEVRHPSSRQVRGFEIGLR